jgi:DNA-directed RNA polymerase specialized sigma24 family protein
MHTNPDQSAKDPEPPLHDLASPSPWDWVHYQELHSWLVRRLEQNGCQKQDAEDVAQETLYKAQLRVQLGEALEPGRGWMLVVGRNIARDRARWSRQVGSVGLCSEHMDALDSSASLVGESGPEMRSEGTMGLLNKIFDAYCGLRDRDQNLLGAWCLTGGDTAAVASALGLHQRAIKVCVFRARERMHLRLRRWQGGNDCPELEKTIGALQHAREERSRVKRLKRYRPDGAEAPQEAPKPDEQP